MLPIAAPRGVENQLSRRLRASRPLRHSGAQQLVPPQRSVGGTRNTIRKRPADIDPNFPPPDSHGFNTTSGYFPPIEIKCEAVRRYILPSATAGVACVPSPSGFRASSLNSGSAASTTTSPSAETL